MRYKAAYRPQYVLGEFIAPITTITKVNDLTISQTQRPTIGTRSMVIYLLDSTYGSMFLCQGKDN